MSDNEPDVAVLTETWLSSEVDDGELALANYSLSRTDRLRDRHGGVMLYARNSWSIVHRDHYRGGDDLWEMLECKLRNAQGRDLHVVAFYRSPSSVDTTWMRVLCQMRMTDSTLLLGDFNVPHADWETLTSKPGATATEREFLDFCLDKRLSQHVREPTRSASGHAMNCLDLVLTVFPTQVHCLSVFPPIASSDHAVIQFDLPVCRPHQPARDLIPNPWRTDFVALRDAAASRSWDTTNLDVQESWCLIRDNLKSLCSTHVPLKRPARCCRGAPWFDRDLRRMLRRRARLWNAFKAAPTTESYGRYRDCRNDVTVLKRQKRTAYEAGLIAAASTHPQRIFSYANRSARFKDEIPILIDRDGTRHCTDAERAELMADHFSSCYLQQTEVEPVVSDAAMSPPFWTVDFTSEKVGAVLRSLDPHKAPGLDAIHPLILKELASYLAQPLSELFSKSMSAGEIPNDWRLGVIKPLFKAGNHNLPENYRPVCLTSVVMKVMEKVVKKDITSFVSHLELLPQIQHGFTEGRSCLSNLLLTRESWAEARQHRLPLDAIFFDFSKAFDRVDHVKLLHRLHAMGFGSQVLAWIKAFVSNRRWAVRVNGRLSRWRPALSGVPQGSVLGPLLFNLYTSDLTRTIESPCAMFADDLKIWRRIDHQDDRDTLQADIDRVSDWSLRNCLPINPAKMVHLTIGSSTEDGYYFEDTRIRQEHTTRDLGVVVSSDLKTEAHTKRTRAAALRMLWMLKRGFSAWTLPLARKLFTTMVRPVLEYATSAAFPLTAHEAELVEGVQRLATRMVPELRSLQYPDRCEAMNLFTMSYRRVRGDMILVFKVLCKGQLPSVRHLFVLDERQPSRGHRFKLEIIRTDCLPHSYRLSRRAPRLWNSLPSDVVEAENVPMFKVRLDSFLWTDREACTKRLLHLPGYPRGW